MHSCVCNPSDQDSHRFSAEVGLANTLPVSASREGKDTNFVSGSTLLCRRYRLCRLGWQPWIERCLWQAFMKKMMTVKMSCHSGRLPGMDSVVALLSPTLYVQVYICPWFPWLREIAIMYLPLKFSAWDCTIQKIHYAESWHPPLRQNEWINKNVWSLKYKVESKFCRSSTVAVYRSVKIVRGRPKAVVVVAVEGLFCGCQKCKEKLFKHMMNALQVLGFLPRYYRCWGNGNGLSCDTGASYQSRDYLTGLSFPWHVHDNLPLDQSCIVRPEWSSQSQKYAEGVGNKAHRLDICLECYLAHLCQWAQQ